MFRCILIFTLTLLFLLSSVQVKSQEKLEIAGAIQVGKSSSVAPAPGTIQWSGSDLIVWNGSKWISLTTGVAFEGEISDSDGNLYRTIQIGTQFWMAENLRTSRYADSSIILQVNNYQSWQAMTDGAWCWYDTSMVYDIPYGKLYNWYAVTDSRGLCPSGWHLPTDADWTTLTNFLGGETVAGGKLKEAGLAHWLAPNVGATNESGFTGLPGGFRESNGNFYEIGGYGSWWTNTVYQTIFAWYRNFYTINAEVLRNPAQQNTGRAVRCVK